MTAIKIKGLVIKKIASPIVEEKPVTVKNIFSVIKDFLLVGGDFA